MTAGHSTIARVDMSLAKARRKGLVTDGALLIAAACVIAALVVTTVAITKLWNRRIDKVGVQWP